MLGLAYDQCLNYGMELNERRQLKSDVRDAIEDAKESDTDYSSVFMQPDLENR